MNKKIHAIILRLNVARPICAMLLGRHHSHSHRMAVGLAVMSIGVMIAKCEHYFEAAIMKLFLDGLGYGLHGLGLTPYIELLSERVQEVEDDVEPDEESIVLATKEEEE